MFWCDSLQILSILLYFFLILFVLFCLILVLLLLCHFVPLFLVLLLLLLLFVCDLLLSLLFLFLLFACFFCFFTPSLAGSIMPINPRYFRFVSVFSLVILFGNVVISLYPTAITLSALFAISKFCFLISALFVISHLSINISGAPFVITIYLFPFYVLLSSFFLVESNGISAILCIWSSVVLLFIPISNAFLLLLFFLLVLLLPCGFVLFHSLCKVLHILSSFFVCCFVSTTFILFCVSVPVLSEQITLLLP